MAPPQGARENPAERKRTRVLVGRPDASGKSKSAEAHTHLAAQPWASRAQRGVPSSTHNESWRAGVQTDRRHAACPAKGTAVPALPAPPAPPPPHQHHDPGVAGNRKQPPLCLRHPRDDLSAPGAPRGAGRRTLARPRRQAAGGSRALPAARRPTHSRGQEVSESGPSGRGPEAGGGRARSGRDLPTPTAASTGNPGDRGEARGPLLSP